MTITTDHRHIKTFSTKAVSYLIAKTKDRKVLEVMIQLQLKATFTKYLLSIRNCLALTWTPLILSTLKGKCLYTHTHTHTHTQDRTWVWANSEKQWRTGKPGEPQFMGSQRIRQTEKLNNDDNTEEPGGLQPRGSQRFRHDQVSTHTHTHIFRNATHEYTQYHTHRTVYSI